MVKLYDTRKESSDEQQCFALKNACYIVRCRMSEHEIFKCLSKTMAEYMGYHGAAIAAVADVLRLVLLEIEPTKA